MSLVRFSRRTPRAGFEPFASFNELENRMRKLAENTFGTAVEPKPGTDIIGWYPMVEITETPTEIMVTAELPGVEKKDVEITVEEGLLSIRGEKIDERKEDDEKTKYHMFERSYGSFQRSFTLPRTVNAEKISAEFDKGVLKVRMPKVEESKPVGRKIDIALK